MYDPGPPPQFEELFARAPDYSPFRFNFWHEWGPVFYRGRLDGTARVLCIASDPGPTERVAGRSLCGDAGQRVQGFLSKLGLTRSYLCLNAFVYALYPSHGGQAWGMLNHPDHLQWRNELYDLARGDDVVAVVAFGSIARMAVDLWPGKDGLEVVEVYHPAYRNHDKLLKQWHRAVTKLRRIVTPDPDGVPRAWNYGTEWRPERDYEPIPREDLPFGMPPWFGDNTWCREGEPPQMNSVYRHPDDGRSLVWTAPEE